MPTVHKSIFFLKFEMSKISHLDKSLNSTDLKTKHEGHAMADNSKSVRYVATKNAYDKSEMENYVPRHQ
jgi:hypothetical protein